MLTRLMTVLAMAGVLTLGLAGCEKKDQGTKPVAKPPKVSKPEAGKPETGTPAAGKPIKVGAIFAVTGGMAFLGGPEERTAKMFVEKLNAAGGVDGHKIELIVKDSGGDATKAQSLAKQLMEEDKVLAIIGPSSSGETKQIKNDCQQGKTILLSCAAAEEIVKPVAGYVFKTPQTDADAARRIFEVVKDKGFKDVGVIASTDGFGKAGMEQLKKLAPDYGVKIAIAESYDPKETDLKGVLTKVKGANVKAVINWTVAPAQALVAKSMKEVGLDVPLFQSHGYGNIKYVQQGGPAANGTIFPCGRLLVADVLPDDHAQKKVLVEYKKDYESKYKEDVSTFGGHAYDALLLLTEAIKKAKSTDTDKVRDALEGLKGVVGTAGVFNMSATDHNGLTADAFEMLTVKDGKFALYTK